MRQPEANENTGKEIERVKDLALVRIGANTITTLSTLHPPTDH